MKKILVNPPDLSRKAALEKCEAKINIIEKQLNVSRVAGDLQKSVQQLKEISCVEEISVIPEDEKVTKEALKTCRDVDQISEKISEFHCQGGVICCRLCPDARVFKYTQDLQTRAEHQSIPLKLSNLKGSLQDHLSSQTPLLGGELMTLPRHQKVKVFPLPSPNPLSATMKKVILKTCLPFPYPLSAPMS